MRSLAEGFRSLPLPLQYTLGKGDMQGVPQAQTSSASIESTNRACVPSWVVGSAMLLSLDGTVSVLLWSTTIGQIAVEDFLES